MVRLRECVGLSETEPARFCDAGHFSDNAVRSKPLARRTLPRGERKQPKHFHLCGARLYDAVTHD